MQGCSFKMVRQELAECTQRHSCSQDGEEKGEEENRRKQRWCIDLGNSCFPASDAKLKSCNYLYCKIMGASLLIARLREKESCC